MKSQNRIKLLIVTAVVVTGLSFGAVGSVAAGYTNVYDCTPEATEDGVITQEEKVFDCTLISHTEDDERDPIPDGQAVQVAPGGNQDRSLANRPRTAQVKCIQVVDEHGERWQCGGQRVASAPTPL